LYKGRLYHVLLKDDKSPRGPFFMRNCGLRKDYTWTRRIAINNGANDGLLLIASTVLWATHAKT